MRSLNQNKKISILSVGTSVPPLRLSQEEILKFVLGNFAIKAQRQELYKKTLSNPSIQFRHFALNSIEEVLETDQGKVNQRFELKTLELAAESLKNSLRKAHMSAKSIDFLIVTTCTGYLCPGIASALIGACKLRDDVKVLDAVGMGCGAALPALEQAFTFVKANPMKIAAVVAVEICSASFFSNDSPDIVISNSIFSDGAASLIVGGSQKANPRIVDFESKIVPSLKEVLRFKNEKGALMNVLGKEVPIYAAKITLDVVNKILKRHKLGTENISHWIVHPGGEKVLSAVQRKLGVSQTYFHSSSEVLRNYGNMSSPSVLFVLEKEMKSHPIKKGEWAVMAAFGAGFSVYVCLIQG